MRFRRRHTPVLRREDNGHEALIVRLHGFGSDEAQMSTLMPMPLAAVVLDPRAPHHVPPGFGWWVADGDELAPTDGIDAAVDRVAAVIATAQAETGIPPTATALVGYSQGATLGLCVAAARPDLLGVVVTGAGFLPPDRSVAATRRPLDVLVMNGAHDPLISADWHDETVARLVEVGHRISDRIDPVPHVVDRAQADVAVDFITGRLASVAPR